jgi:hypothetical protein
VHRLSLLTALLHPEQLRAALRPHPGAGPSRRATADGALRCGASVALALLVVALLGHRELAGYASLGALASLYGRSAEPGWRLRLMVVVGTALTAAVVLMSSLGATHAPTVVALAALVLLAAGATAGAAALRTGPPGATILVFAAGAGTAPVAGAGDVVARGAAVAGGVLLAVVVGSAGARGWTWRALGRGPRLRSVLRAGTADRAVLAPVLTVAAAAALSASLATWAGWGHPAWAVMGASAALQGTHVRHMGVRALQRAAGTVCGALLALPLLGAHLGFVSVAVLVVVLQTVTELVVARHYGAAMLTITPMALLMTSIGTTVDPTGLALDRALDTAVGAALGVLVAVAAARPDDPPRPTTAGSEVDALQHLGDQRRDGRALGAGQGDVGEQRVALERLDDRRDTVVPPDAQVVPLGDVVGQHHP